MTKTVNEEGRLHEILFRANAGAGITRRAPFEAFTETRPA